MLDATHLLAGVADFNARRRADPALAVDLTDADLRGADLQGALLLHAHMDRCLLDDADLRGASLSGASLTGASLRRADLRDLCCEPLPTSPLGPAPAAILKKTSLVAAWAARARLRDVDLRTCDLTDCDLRSATGFADPAHRHPPAADDREATLARLAREPADVRDGLGTIAIVTFLAGDRSDAADDLVAELTAGVGLSEDDIQRLMPRGPVALDALTIAAPASDWARRAALAWMCAVAGASARVAPVQVQVLGHFGAAFGFGARALTRILGAELGLDARG